MTEEERTEWKDLMQKVINLNAGHHDLVRQSIVFGEQLAEQSERIAELYKKIDAKLNGI